MSNSSSELDCGSSECKNYNLPCLPGGYCVGSKCARSLLDNLPGMLDFNATLFNLGTGTEVQKDGISIDYVIDPKPGLDREIRIN